ncbi:MAG: exo-alpha-sialidase, partial [Planctomycetes bacterium]|nr:exo-alpha-sialidase [Planctomycetota bacterium]
FVRRSSDEMETLSEPICATDEKIYHVINNDRLIQLSSGRLLVPAALHSCEDGTRETWSSRADATCYYSDDEGESWNRAPGTLTIPDRIETHTGLQEPGVVELGDGRVFLWARTDLGTQYEAISEDGGETWSEPRPGPLVSPVAPASIKRLSETDDLMVVWNDHSGKHPFPEGKRTPLCAAISRDEGRTWEISKVLEDNPDGWYCYISMTVVDDAVLLGYCAGDSDVGGLNRLKITRVPQRWLYE